MKINLKEPLRRIYYRTKDFIFKKEVLNIYSNKFIPTLDISKTYDKLEIRQCFKEDSHLILAVGDNISVEKLNSRLKRNDSCFVALLDGIPVHFSWVSFDLMRISEISYEHKLRKNEAFIYHCFTCPEFRGKGIYPFVLSYIAGLLRKNGTKNILISAIKRNESSCRGILKAGFAQDTFIFYLRLLGIKFYHKMQNSLIECK